MRGGYSGTAIMFVVLTCDPGQEIASKYQVAVVVANQVVDCMDDSAQVTDGPGMLCAASL